MRAFLKNYRQSPRKVRLVADVIRGKDVRKARITLDVISKRASSKIKKLLESAIANARNNFSTQEDKLFVKEIRVDKGTTLKRNMPRAFGRATPINKRTSNVSIVLAEREEK